MPAPRPPGPNAPTDAWTPRGAAYAASAPHAHGPSLPRLLALLRPGPEDRALDVGTGAGHAAARLAALCREVVALDPSPGMLAAARAAYGHLPGLRFVQAYGHDTDLDDASFDLACARHTLHHHADAEATVREVARLLRPGGRFVLVDEIALPSHLDGWYDLLSRTRDPSHVRTLELDGWRALLRRCGLEPVVGDADTRYALDVDAWIARMDPTPEAEAETRRLLREAPPEARERLRFAWRADGEVARFSQPMAVMLAVRPERSPA